MKRQGVWFFIVVLALALVWWMRQPVMLRLPSAFSHAVILGPLRNRAPERVAEDFLRGLQQGQCSSLTQGVQLSNTNCEKEQSSLVTSWRLLDRVESDGGLSLKYAWGNSQVPISNGDWLGVGLQKSGDRWKVSNYDRVF